MQKPWGSVSWNLYSESKSLEEGSLLLGTTCPHCKRHIASGGRTLLSLPAVRTGVPMVIVTDDE